MELSRRELSLRGRRRGAMLALDRTALAARPERRVVRRIDFTGAAGRRRAGPRLAHASASRTCAARAGGACSRPARTCSRTTRGRSRSPSTAGFATPRSPPTITAPGSAPGVVLRRRSTDALLRGGLRHRPGGAPASCGGTERSSTSWRACPAPAVQAPFRLTLAATGARPTLLQAAIVDSAGASVSATARDDLAAALQRRGDPGVLATAETLFPSEREPGAAGARQPAPAALGGPGGPGVHGDAHGSRRSSTRSAGARRRRFSEIVGHAARAPPAPAPPTVVAATTGPPGARRRRAPRRVGRAGARRDRALVLARASARAADVRVGRTGDFDAATRPCAGCKPGRPRLLARAAAAGGRTLDRARAQLPRAARARGSRRAGPDRGRPPAARSSARSSTTSPSSGRTSFVWQGDLNYPDTHGPLAQTMSGYAGIWRDFLANPLLEPILRDAAFAAQRDDHDYGVQDANSTTIGDFPWGLAPWEALMSRRAYYRFPAGPAEFWVLDQRTLQERPRAGGHARTRRCSGPRQRRWLFETLAPVAGARSRSSARRAPLFMAANARDGNWATGFDGRARPAARRTSAAASAARRSS